MEYAVIDLETTSNRPDNYCRIVEIGVICLNENLEETDKFETIIQTSDGRIPKDAAKVNKLSRDMLKPAPRLETVIDDLYATIQGRALIAHNKGYDRTLLFKRLNRYKRLQGGMTLDTFIPFICTMHFAKKYIEADNSRLETYCDLLGIENSQPHSAIGDARATADLFRYIANQATKQHGEGNLPWQNILDETAVWNGFTINENPVSAEVYTRTMHEDLNPRLF